MTNFKLSEHFNLIEFERSSTAVANHIDNTCPPQFIPSLQQLCKEVLEPLRAFAGQPIIIGSGYRCNALNIKVGGVYASQHTLGEAADIQNTNFDQAIIETGNGKDFWIHVSCRKSKSKNRHQVIRNLVKK